MKKKGRAFWAFLHLALFAVLGLCLLFGRHFGINTNLFDILPDSSSMKSVGHADKALGAKTGAMFFILAESPDFEGAKKGAEALAAALRNGDANGELFENLSLTTAGDQLDEIIAFYYKNRFLLLDRDTIKEAETEEGMEALGEEALENAFSGFSITPVEYLEGDPFGFTEIELQNLIQKISSTGTGLSLKDGVLAAEYGGKNYVMIRGSLTPKGASITNKNSGIKKIYECAEKIQGVKFIYSGVPFHSYASSSDAQKQVTLISTISLLAVVVLLFFVFRSLLPILWSILAISLSVLAALVSTLLAFGQIHILTFVFGTTLIGTCLDYSVHYFIRWKFEKDLRDGKAIRKKLFKGLSLSFISTEVCYLILFFAPFMLLKQIAVFCFAGIASTFLTTILLYPSIPLAEKKTQSPFNFKFAISQKTKKICLAAVAIFFIATAIFYRNNLVIDNDLRKFYSMSGKLLNDEIFIANVLNRKSNPWYFIAKGASQDELLQKEEEFCDKLDEFIATGQLSSYTAVSQFIPSKKHQIESLQICDKIMDSDIATRQCETLGFENTYLRLPEENQSFVSMDGEIPDYLKSALSALWIGQVDGEWFSAIMPSGAEDAEAFKKLCSENEGVFFVNKMQDIAFELNRLTRIMLLLLAVAFVVLTVGLNFFYKPKTVLRIAAVPFMVLLAEAAVMSLLNIPLGFFSVTGIVLVFGLGLDYIIYTVESSGTENLEDIKLNSLSVLISFLTTSLSFGAIAFSSFMPVHVFGTVVFIGLVSAWLVSKLNK